MKWLYASLRLFTIFCFKFFGRLEVRGAEYVPRYGPLIVISNHLSYNDPPALFASTSRILNYLGKIELFSNPYKSFLMRLAKVHPLDRSGSGLGALKTALEVLSKDGAIVIFPEGRISPCYSMQKAKQGAAFLAIKSQAPILPIGISGTEKFPPWRMVLPLQRFRVNIGPPFTPPVLEGKINKNAIDSVSELMMNRIAVLLPEHYRGIYSIRARQGPQSQRSPDVESVASDDDQ